MGLMKSKERLANKRAKLAAEEAERKRVEEEEEEKRRAEEEANKKGKKKGAGAVADKKPVSPAKTRGSNVDVLEVLEGESDRGNTADKSRKGEIVENYETNGVKKSNSEIMAMVSDEISDKYKRYERSSKDVQHVVNFWHRERLSLIRPIVS